MFVCARFPSSGRTRFAFITAPIFSARPSHNEQEGRAQISRCASGAGGRTCQSESGPKGWRGLLAQRTPPMRAAAKRRSQVESAWGVGPRREVYGARAGRLTAERRGSDVGAFGYWAVLEVADENAEQLFTEQLQLSLISRLRQTI